MLTTVRGVVVLWPPNPIALDTPRLRGGVRAKPTSPADALATLPAVSIALHECSLADVPDVPAAGIARPLGNGELSTLAAKRATGETEQPCSHESAHVAIAEHRVGSGHVLQRLRRSRGHDSKGRGRIVHLDQHDKGLRQ